MAQEPFYIQKPGGDESWGIASKMFGGLHGEFSRKVRIGRHEVVIDNSNIERFMAGELVESRPVKD